MDRRTDPQLIGRLLLLLLLLLLLHLTAGLPRIIKIGQFPKQKRTRRVSFLDRPIDMEAVT